RRGGIGEGLRGRAEQAGHGTGEGAGRAPRRPRGGRPGGRGLSGGAGGAPGTRPARIPHRRQGGARAPARLDTASLSPLQFPPTFGRVPRDQPSAPRRPSALETSTVAST